MNVYAKAQRHWIKAKGWRCPYIALMDADRAGRGLRLSAADVQYMAGDTALSTIAANHVDEVLPEESEE
jgi:hypothetical protein